MASMAAVLLRLNVGQTFWPVACLGYARHPRNPIGGLQWNDLVAHPVDLFIVFISVLLRCAQPQ